MLLLLGVTSGSPVASVGVEKSTDEPGEVASFDGIPGVGQEAVGDGKPLEDLRWGDLHFRKISLAGTQEWHRAGRSVSTGGTEAGTSMLKRVAQSRGRRVRINRTW